MRPSRRILLQVYVPLFFCSAPSYGVWTGSAFEMDDGASLHMAGKGLREETISQGLLHEIVAKELQTNIVSNASASDSSSDKGNSHSEP